MAVQIQLRRDTAANWASANPVLALGEMGFETDTLKYKLGDGVTAWNSLLYGAFDGFTSGRRYVFDDAVSDADPGAGELRFDNATFASITKLFFDDADAAGGDATAWLDLLDDSTDPDFKGTLFLQKATDPEIYREFVIHGDVAAGTGYRKVPVTPLTQNGLLADGDVVVVAFYRAASGSVDGARLLPAGGTTGQVAVKASDDDYDVAWVDPPAGAGGINTPAGRLSLISGVALPVSDVTGATSIYFTPAGGNKVPIYDGSSYVSTAFSELTLELDNASGHSGYHQSGKIFDLFAANDAGTVRLGTGPAWSSATARGAGAGTTELETFEGLAVNKNSITLRFGSSSGDTVSVAARRATYVGSFRATADGQATDGKAKRLLFNAYNPVERLLFVEGPENHEYSTATQRPINNDASNCVEVLLGLVGAKVKLEACNTVGNSTSSYRTPANGISIGTPLLNVALGKWISVSDAAFACLDCLYEGVPGLGHNQFIWLEVGAGVDTQTFYQSGSFMTGQVIL